MSRVSRCSFIVPQGAKAYRLGPWVKARGKSRATAPSASPDCPERGLFEYCVHALQMIALCLRDPRNVDFAYLEQAESELIAPHGVDSTDAARSATRHE